MSPRRVALMVVMALVAATSAIGATAARAASNDTMCVALVVDGRALDSAVSTSCATVNKGATGVGVLRAAGHTVGYRSDGLICTLDGLPRSGCADVDDTHYWAYFHRAPGATAWTYSSEGASTYKPANASTEGWVYRDGTALMPPENVPYSQICTAKTTPSPTATPSTKPTHKPTPHQNTTSTPTPTTKATPTPVATVTTTTPAKPSHRHPSNGHQGNGHHRPSSRPSTRHHHPSTRRPSATAAPVRSVGAASTEAEPESHVLLKFLIGVVLVAGLAALAFSGFRRR